MCVGLHWPYHALHLNSIYWGGLCRYLLSLWEQGQNQELTSQLGNSSLLEPPSKEMQAAAIADHGDICPGNESTGSDEFAETMKRKESNAHSSGGKSSFTFLVSNFHNIKCLHCRVPAGVLSDVTACIANSLPQLKFAKKGLVLCNYSLL